jgi:cobalt/nickel transport system permease protein
MHIHIPDGVLPIWLWIAGYVLALALVALAVRRVRGQERKGVLAAVMVAVMLVVQSIPLGVPYHINLSALTGIILGPWWALISILVTNAAQASFGHGGVTIVGLNTLVVWTEALIGYYLFAALRRMLKSSRLRISTAAGASTLVALIFSAFLVVGIVGMSGIDPSEALGEHAGELLGVATPAQISLTIFATLVLPIAIGGALIEAVITALLVAYVLQVKASLIVGRE